MSIVRSLLIKIGLTNDRQSFSQADRAVGNFKRRAVIAASAITYAFSQVTQYFSDFADRILNTNDFSKRIGVAIEDLYALQRAAQRVARVQEKDFQSAVGKVSKMFQDLRIGASAELSDIAQYLGFEIDRVNDNGVTIFNKILTGLSNVKNDAQRLKLAELIFPDAGARFAELAMHLGEFKEATRSFKEEAPDLSSTITSAEDYAKAVTNIGESWTRLMHSLSRTVFPILENIMGYMTGILDLISGIFTGSVDLVTGALKRASAALDPIFNALGLDKISQGNQNLFWGGQTLVSQVNAGSLQRAREYAENREGYKYTGILQPNSVAISPAVTFNNNITVPAGTTEEQAKYMGDMINRQYDESFINMFRNIQYNNPVAE